MRIDGTLATQRECASRAMSRLLIARLARRLAETGVLRAIGAAIVSSASLSKRVPSEHLLIDRVSVRLQPLRDSGVAAGGAGGGGSGFHCV